MQHVLLKVNADIVTKELSLILPKSIDPSAFTPLLRQFNQYKDEVGQFLLREPVRNLVMDLLANPAVSKNVLRWLLKFMRDDCQYWHVKYPSYPSIDSSDSARHKTWKTLLNMCRKINKSAITKLGVSLFI
ncbi:hypothetical protein BC937DRAFT_88004 [Endogone sp. FLAS-F59071]|nr:hypothetical protein BC937DRAFT_88004 [Endogone sp. FLAS-F59071]|eukprot:RUS19087.1 hypothetical protein BC937DRAFT_88004 [Endogone sp. FLAS-F59071]